MISPVYEYSSGRLWLAYGLVIAISTLTVIAGLIVMYLSNAAYSSSLSTILRRSRGAHLGQEIVDGDHDGKEPLPEYLAKSNISFAGAALWKQHTDGDAEYELVPVQVPEPVTTQESPGGRVDSHRQSTLRLSAEEYEGCSESNGFHHDRPAPAPQDDESVTEPPSPSIEEDADGGFPPPFGPDLALQVPQPSSRI